MSARIPQTIKRLRPAPTRRGHRPPSPAPPPEPPDPEARVREAGGPEDRACYSCSCGLVFEAEVSTSVSCPHCGSDQAW
jgi:hypothetical protein